MSNLTYRKARREDLPALIELFLEDESPEFVALCQDKDKHIQAFHHLDADPNQYLMVVLLGEKIVAACHLTFIPFLALIGGTRLQIQAVNVSSPYRKQKIGSWMMQQAIDYGRAQGAQTIQLTVSKENIAARKFYENLGFKDSHEGMRLRLI